MIQDGALEEAHLLGHTRSRQLDHGRLDPVGLGRPMAGAIGRFKQAHQHNTLDDGSHAGLGVDCQSEPFFR